MSRRSIQLARSVERCEFKKVIEGRGKDAKLVNSRRRSHEAAINLITPSNAGERFNKRITNV
jgi:hypothetical protein